MINSTEKKTITSMIRIYCVAKHQTSKNLCPQCAELDEYAQNRLSRCRYGNDKPTCKKCPTHCYNTVMKAGIQEIMRFAGPRMLFHHPILAIKHLLKGFK
ncbi:MAG: nitrous oxide-stimulated promoter family protein [Dysgonomonas sp.]